MSDDIDPVPETVEPPVPVQRFILDANGIATIGAVILSIVAISVSLLEVSTMRTQQRASDPSNGVISANETVRLFSVAWEDRTRLFAQQAQNRANITACYCSIHKQCWQTSLNQDGADEVESCS